MLRALLAALIVIASTETASEPTSVYPQIIPPPNDAVLMPDQRAKQAYEAYRFAAAHRYDEGRGVATVKARCSTSAGD